ncbi:GRIP and coiled-coil domain-containing protein 2-like isoform X2 [Sceloporus undulatus]|uniref:GRIP and coiled-coil domain-containing protein 2-like isoform X2 n=1 Tax=Sceloporus undulatus TaxID=8520 RepID=UPI001C4CA1B3|nr:GRIP and coiled-coil domain-containing protein 2-like isoform X2 [Sceloporus undulatus]
MKLSALSEKRKLLQEKLDSNLKDLQEAQMLASLQPDSMNERKVEELTEQRKKLTDDLKAATNDMLEIQHHPSKRALFERPSEKEMSKIYRLSEKKQLLLEKLESNQKELQEAEKLAATQPGSVSAHTLQELSKQRKHLNEELEATLDGIQNIFDASERTVFVRPVGDYLKTFLLTGRELDDLSVKKKELLEMLESNRKELQEAQEHAILQPGSISDHKLQTLFNERRRLTTELETTMNDIQKAQEPTLEGTTQYSGRELYELSAKKHELMEQLKSNQKELQEARELADAQPGSISESKLQELAEQNRRLTENLEETLRDIVKVERLASEKALTNKLAGRELHELSSKKQLLQLYLDSNLKALQEAQNLAATQPGSINEQKVQELVEERRQLSADLKATIKKIHEAEQHASERGLTEQSSDQELYDLFEKKHLLQGNLESNWKEIQEAQTLEAAQPGSIPEHKLEELAQERRRLTEDLEKTAQDIQKVKRSSSVKVPAERHAERELYELSERKQLLLENLKGLQEAQALAATQPGTVGEEKRKQLAEQKRRLAADLEATVHDMQKAQHASEIPVTLKPSENELYELLEKKYLLLENLASNRKELQEAHALADAQPGSVSDHKLQMLNEQRKHLTEDLKATVHDIQKIQHHASQKAPTEGELFELSEKKQLLMESLESKQKELQEAKALAASQPDTISEQKLQELAEQKTQLTIALEATMHDIREIQHRTPQRELPEEPCEKDLHKLFEWKQRLLEHTETNLKELEETHALVGTEPDSISEGKIQELNEQRKILTENLEAVVQEMQQTKAYLSKTGGIIRPIEKDLDQLFQKKKMFLERFESNSKLLEAAQKYAAIYPSHINEQKVQELTAERRLLAAGLEAIIEDLEEEEEVAGIRGRERILEELTGKKKVFLHNLAFSLKELKQAQALAAAQPDSSNEQRVQELLEQTKLLAGGLDAIMQEIKSLFLDKAEIVKPDEQDLSEKRRCFLENLELNLEELKNLEAAASAEPDSVSEQKRQELTDKRALLAANLESMLQDMQEAEAPDLEQSVMTIPDEKNLNDLLVLTRLESKLNELEKSGTFSSIQLDGIRKRMQSLKELKSSSTDKWELPVVEADTNVVDKTAKEKAVKEFIEQRKHLFSYLQSSIKELQEKGIIRQSSAPDKDFQSISREKVDLDKYLVAVPIDILQSEAAALHTKYGQDDESITKQKVLAAKLEANMKDLQAALEGEKMGKRRYGAPRDILKTLIKRRMLVSESAEEQQLKPSLSGLQIQISKAPVLKKSKTGQSSSYRKAETEVDSSVQDYKDKLLQKETELAFKRQFMPPSSGTQFPQLSGSKISLPQLPSTADSDIKTERYPVDPGLQEIFNFNKNLILGQKANLQQALQLAQQQLLQQQPSYILPERLRNMSVLLSQPSGTTRAHDYSMQPSRPVWEANQLPQKDYGRKLNMLKRKLIGPGAKGNLSI